MTNTINRFILSILFLSAIINLQAQDRFIHYSVKDGLPQMQCLKLFQDSKGYIWIGTKGGISKYDGITFKNYNFDNGLTNSYVSAILEDNKNNIYFLTRNSLCKVSDNKIIEYKISDDFFIDDSQKSFIKDDNNVLYFLAYKTKNKYNLFSFKNGKFENISEKIKLYFINVNYIKYNKQDKSIIITDFLMNKSKKTIIHKLKNDKIKSDTINLGLFIKWTDSQYYTSINILYIKIDSTLRQIQKFSSLILNFHKLSDSSYVVLTMSSFYHFDKNDNKLFYKEFENYNSDLLIDKEENIWIANESGLYKYSSFNNFNTSNSGIGPYVWGITEDKKGTLYFASYNFGITSLKKNKWKKINTQEVIRFYFNPVVLNSGEILFPESLGLFKLKNNKFTLVAKTGAVLSTFYDKKTEIIYLGTKTGFYEFSENKLLLRSKKYNQINGKLILSFCKNNKNQLWFASRQGIGYFTEKDTVFISNDSTPLIGATAIYCDKNDNLWIGANNGLFFYDYKKFYRIIYPELTNQIGSVYEVDSNTIVYGGSKGIGILNLKKFYSINNYSKNSIDAMSFVDFYDKSFGFMGEEVGQNGIFKDSKGRIWVPTNTNVVMFKPEDLKLNKTAPFTHITNSEYSEDNITWIKINDTITKLNHKKNYLKFNFIGINQTAPNLVQYKYRLLGMNNQWSKMTKDKKVTYTNLKPGKYTFQVMACNSKGIWNKKPVEKKIEIIPAIWQTTSFRIIAFLLIIISVSILVFVIARAFYQRKHTLDKLTDLQFNSLTNQLYPHFLFNAIANIASSIYSNDKNTAYDYTAKLTNLIREVQNDREKFHKTLKEELEFVNSYLEIQTFRFKNRFTYEIKIDESINQDMEVPQMILQSFVENAVKHGLEHMKKDGKLIVSAKKYFNNIKLSVEDNGIGINAAKKLKTPGTGKGMRIISEIIELYNKNYRTNISFEIIDLYKIGENGTRVEINIPMLLIKK